MASRLDKLEESGVVQTRSNDEKALIESQIATSPAFDSEKIEGVEGNEVEVFKAIPPLVAHLQDGWARARDDKDKGIRSILDDSKYKRNNTYSPQELSKITSGSKAFSPITSRKCVTAESTIVDMVAGERPPYDFTNTPKPELSDNTIEQITNAVAKDFMERLQENPSLQPQDAFEQAEIAHKLYSEEIHEQAKQAYMRMKKRMDDQLHHGKFVDAFKEFAYDLVTYPAAIIKHEIVSVKTSSWKKNKYITEIEPIHSWKRVSPFNFYPSPNTKTVNDGDMFELVKFKRKDLALLRSNKAYRKDAIERVLGAYGSIGVNAFHDRQMSRMVSTETERQDGLIDSGNVIFDAIEFWGSVSGELLMEWGVKGVKDKYEEYDITAVMVADEVIRVALNPNREGTKPYYSASYDPSPDSIWGQGIPQKIKDSQEISNTIRRNTINNINLSSGPQVVVNTSLLDPKSGSFTTIRPFKVWMMRSTGTNQRLSASDAFSFVNVPSVVPELMNAEQYYAQQADEDSGVTRISEGNIAGTSGTAAMTATGATLLNENANRTSRKIMAGIDKGVIKPLIRDLYMFNMMDEEVPDVEKFDADIMAFGSLNVNIKQELNARREKFLLLILQNYASLRDVYPPDKLMVLLREIASNLELPVDQVVPSKEEMEGKEAQDIQAQMAQIEQQAQTQTISTMIDGGMTEEEAFTAFSQGQFSRELDQSDKIAKDQQG